MDLTINHFDTCLSCYLQNHCNGEREFLIGVAIQHDTTFGELFEELRSEVIVSSDERITEQVSAAYFEELDELRAEFDAAAIPSFCANLDDNSDVDPDELETCSAWFRVSWTD